MLEGQRPVNLEVLSPYAVPDVRPPLGVGALVWRYTVLVPVVKVRQNGEATPVATYSDLENLRNAFCEDFGGVTFLQSVVGYGLRDPRDPTSLELNRNVPFVVYARPLSASDRYFERLQQELQEALVQGLVVVERQEVLLLGTSQPAVGTRSLQGPGKTALPPPNA
jgi:PII-like signaling protein